jgi:hypothetical protein
MQGEGLLVPFKGGILDLHPPPEAALGMQAENP